MQIKSWVNKRVLITGSSGFIGSHLQHYLEKKGAKTLGISRHPKHRKNEKSVDISDFKKLSRIFKTFKPHVCFHLASEALVESGQKFPYETFNNNIGGTLNLLELCRLYKVHRIIVASSVHVYGNSPLPYKEAEPARPSRPYETSKAASDLIAQSYADSFGLPVLIPRFVNVYGPGDKSASRIIPKTIQTILSHNAPTMWGGTAERDYLYIDDVIRAYDRLARIRDAHLGKNRIFNFGTGKAISAEKLISLILRFSGSSAKIKKIKTGRLHELDIQRVSWAKAKRILGWLPRTNLKVGLSMTIKWHKEQSANSI